MVDRAALRLFVATYPAPELAAELLARVASIADLRLPPADQVHLTLQFIGDTDPRQLDEVIESVARATSGLHRAAIGVVRLITLPQRGPARLVAAELEAHPTVLELHRRLASRLARNSKERSSTVFLPHITLGRFPSPGAARTDTPLADQTLFFRLNEIALMQSVLRPDRAEHRVLSRYPLAE